jgi:hypothetical protein
MGSDSSEDAGSARQASRERPLSPVAEAQQWRSSVPSPLGQWETEKKISPYCKSQIESVYAASNRCAKRASDAGPRRCPVHPWGLRAIQLHRGAVRKVGRISTAGGAVLVVWGSGAAVLPVSGLPHPTRSAGTLDEALGSTAAPDHRGRRASGSPQYWALWGPFRKFTPRGTVPQRS